MYRSGPLPLAFEGPEQGLRGKNCKILSQEKQWFSIEGEQTRRLKNVFVNMAERMAM